MIYEGIRIRPTKARPNFVAGQAEAGGYTRAPSTSTSGYHDLEEAVMTCAEGAYVIDKRGLPWESLRHVVSGPMDKCELPERSLHYALGEPVSFPSIEAALAHYEANPLSMAFMSLDVYAEYWRRLGAKVGRVRKGEVAWKPSLDLCPTCGKDRTNMTPMVRSFHPGAC